MLYKKNDEKKLSENLFMNPTSEFRGTPFWAWNSYLEKDELNRQIDIFKEMGLGGFHMHVRTGLENEYLSDEYMDLVKNCVEKAKSENMLAWLYDEDRWPSGAAGGIVTKNHKLRQRYITFTVDSEKFIQNYRKDAKNDYQEDDYKLLTIYDIVLDSEGYMISCKQINNDEKAIGTKWYLYSSCETTDSWHNDQTYIDTLNKEAVDEFIRVTHERYNEVVGNEFDKTVPAIFTDEPQVYRKHQLTNSFDTYKDLTMPWTENLPQAYMERYNADIFEHLPEIIWEIPRDQKSPHRYYYHDIIGDLFAESFADNIGKWCTDHSISLTGHMMEEPSLESQTHSTSEAMRSYRSFGIPGIDLLCNSREFTTAKQCQSAVHQYGKEGMLSELYGVTSWNADFRLYKFSGDWQAALGVTVRVPHLSWYAMQGEAKRDYPASINYQSPWYDKYNIIEDHYARLNTALTRGKPVVKVGVIHPIESYWLHYGPNDKTENFRMAMEERFNDVTNWLLSGSIDFDFISESLLPELCKNGSNPLKVGKMNYDAVIVPGCETLRSSTVERLKAFKENGGKLVFMGKAPSFCDALPSDLPAQLWNASIKIDFSRSELLNILNDNRDITIRYGDGKLSNDHFYALRQDNDCKWLFICHSEEPNFKDKPNEKSICVTVNDEYKAELWNTLDGHIYKTNVTYRNGKTILSFKSNPYDSFLFKLTPGKEETKVEYISTDMENANYVSECESFELTENNVLVLDIAEFSVDGSDFYPREEILKLDNKARALVGLRKREGSVVQPWVIGKTPAEHNLLLKFKFESDINYSGAELALEDADKAELIFNGNPISNSTSGWYVDKKINKVKLPDIIKGSNELLIKYPLGERTNTENVFVLGKFGVKITGQSAKITDFPEKIYFGNLVYQGMPFYGGNIIYKFHADIKNNKLMLNVNSYRGTLISVSVDGTEKGNIVFNPYTLIIDGLDNGTHEIELKLYLHRANTFGPLHLTNLSESWHGPGAWRSTGDNWCYEYVLKETGIIAAPKYI